MPRRFMMGFWENETCEYCGGPIVERCVMLCRKVKDACVPVENVPAGVCMECGAHYYAANVLKIVQEGP